MASAPSGVAVVEAFADAGEAVRTAVCGVDHLEAGERSTGQRDQQFLPSDLGGIVVERGQHPVDQADPVPGAPALHEVRPPRRVRRPGRGGGGRVPRYEGRCDQRVQPVRPDRPGAQQFQVGQHPGRRVGQYGQGGAAALRGRRDPQAG